MADGGCWGILAGQPTDDSELAWALARALIASSEFDAEIVVEAYTRWYASAPFDIGNTTSRALAAAFDAAPGERARAATQAASMNSQANGSLMRVSPIGIASAGDPVKAAEWARQDSKLTHPHPVCQAACAAYCAAIAVAIAGGNRVDMLEEANAQAGRDAEADLVRSALADAAVGPPVDYQKQMGWVLIALRNAFYHLQAGHRIERTVLDTIHRGGDTDTNGAIAGALVGSADGKATFPDRWAAPILSCRATSESGTRHPRPEEYWPSDALTLASRLVDLSGVVDLALE